jgi:hypothetical protein
MPHASDRSYRLVVFDAVEDPDSVRDLICRATGLHATDANRWIARMPGIGERPISQSEAKTLLDGLYEMEIAAEARAADALPDLSPPRTAHSVACLPEGFRVSGLRGEPLHWVPWDKVELIDAGLVEQPDEERAVTPPAWVVGLRNGLNAILRRPSMIARRERTLRFNREPVGEVVLVRSDPTLAFRLPANALNYRYLGDRLRPSSGENFPLLMADLQKYSRGDAFTRAASSLLENAQSAPTFPSSQALLDHAILNLLWNWYRRDRENAGPPDATHGSTEPEPPEE